MGGARCGWDGLGGGLGGGGVGGVLVRRGVTSLEIPHPGVASFLVVCSFLSLGAESLRLLGPGVASLLGPGVASLLGPGESLHLGVASLPLGCEFLGPGGG